MIAVIAIIAIIAILAMIAIISITAIRAPISAGWCTSRPRTTGCSTTGSSACARSPPATWVALLV